MTAVRSVAAAAAELGQTFGGELLKPGDAGYEEARKVHNGLVDKRPALIARCRHVADVADAIRLTQRLGLEVAVRGGGHNVAERATIDGGVMIDLAPMKKICVDPENRTVRAQAASRGRSQTRETQRYVLAVTGGVVSSTGIAGLTLGGGLGWLMGKQVSLSTTSCPSSCSRRGRGDTDQPGRGTRSVLGRSRRRRQLRCGDVPGISAASGGPGSHRRPDRAPIRPRP